jgi:hypothetical protein
LKETKAAGDESARKKALENESARKAEKVKAEKAAWSLKTEQLKASVKRYH